MTRAQSDILLQLQKEILPLQGYKPPNQNNTVVDLGPVNHAFPQHQFPTGAIHEFLSPEPENAAATGGFIAGIMGELMKAGGLIFWISSNRSIFPPALKYFGIAPHKIIFIQLKKTKELLWTLEETLSHQGLTAVVGELQDIDLTGSRRLQLAVEQSRVTGFILRNNPRNQATACISRWKIESIPSPLPDNIPGVGYPRWNVNLLKIRNGKPGSWQLEWAAGKFKEVLTETPYEHLHSKTG